MEHPSKHGPGLFDVIEIVDADIGSLSSLYYYYHDMKQIWGDATLHDNY